MARANIGLANHLRDQADGLGTCRLMPAENIVHHRSWGGPKPVLAQTMRRTVVPRNASTHCVTLHETGARSPSGSPARHGAPAKNFHDRGVGIAGLMQPTCARR